MSCSHVLKTKAPKDKKKPVKLGPRIAHCVAVIGVDFDKRAELQIHGAGNGTYSYKHVRRLTMKPMKMYGRHVEIWPHNAEDSECNDFCDGKIISAKPMGDAKDFRGLRAYSDIFGAYDSE